MDGTLSRRRILAGVHALLLSKQARATPAGEKLANDRHRPQYHFLAPANWMNDPSRPIYNKGHVSHALPVEFAHSGVPPSQRVWGHATIREMAYWKPQPIGLDLEPTEPDSRGVWSGAVVIDNGVPTAAVRAAAANRT
jgi:beta-fructofuranosidase